MKGKFLYLNPLNSVIIPSEDKESKTKTKQSQQPVRKKSSNYKGPIRLKSVRHEAERTLLNNHKKSVRFLDQHEAKEKKAMKHF